MRAVWTWLAAAVCCQSLQLDCDCRHGPFPLNSQNTWFVTQNDLCRPCPIEQYSFQAAVAYGAVQVSFVGACTLNDNSSIVLVSNDDDAAERNISISGSACVDSDGDAPQQRVYQFGRPPSIVVQHAAGQLAGDTFTFWVALTDSYQWYNTFLWVCFGLVVAGCAVCLAVCAYQSYHQSTTRTTSAANTVEPPQVTYSSGQQATELSALDHYLSQQAPLPELPKYEQLFAVPTSTDAAQAPASSAAATEPHSDNPAFEADV